MIILGGPSGINWGRIKRLVQPDFLIGVNGVSCVLGYKLKYYLNVEAWDGRYGIPPGFNDSRPTYRLINWKRYRFLTDRHNVIKVRRGGPVFLTGSPWSIRRYDNGLATGPPMIKHVKVPTLTGTVAAQALHLAGILGLTAVHTIGLDLCWQNGEHHWFDYPPITADNRYWYPSMLTEHKGLKTMHWWIESAEYLRTLKAKMLSEGLSWQDHSNGLLQAMGVF
ncbi:MAG TPA: hypothetical protein VLH56_19185 [Dissulfurispiraceae bacterium]|nr:hypothetical protein [Dissulfurispiraceae bacterium]